MSLITVGTVAFDAIETPFGSSGKIVGGAASYIGLSASQFVKEQHIISVIGDDFPAELHSGIGIKGHSNGWVGTPGGREELLSGRASITWT